MEIKQAEFVTSAISKETIPNEASMPEFMFCGRSNVGKSSFINALVNQNGLARTSQNPGKTQTLNIFLINNSFLFVDVPGYGYAKVSKKLKESFGVMIEDYIKNSQELTRAFLLVDYRHTPTEDDLIMYNYLKYYDIPVTVIATKSDKVKNKDRKHNKEAILNKLNLVDGDNLIITSSDKKVGLNLVKDQLEKDIINFNNNALN